MFTSNPAPRTSPQPAAMRLLALVFLIACTAALYSPPEVLAHVAPLTDRQMVGYSKHVVVATVESQEIHWNPQHTFIMTDYVLSIEDRFKGGSPSLITLSMPGGTLDGETHSTCVSTPLETGNRYLLFLGNLDETTLSPVTGAWQGVFREMPAKDGTSYITTGLGAPSPIEVNGEAVEFRTFIAAVREMVQEIESSPQAIDEPSWKLNPGLPAKTYDPMAALPDASVVTAPLAPSTLQLPAPLAIEASVAEGTSLLALAGSRYVPGKYVIPRVTNPPVIYNQLPSSLAPWSPNDQYAMSYWNVYANNLFRVFANPTGTWAFRNGVFDIAGWPTNDQMAQQFNWTWSAGILGVTFYTTISGPIVEADIALNPYVSWTLNQALGTRPGSGYAMAQHTLLHELGHGWGLAHPWETQNVWWDSVMNYAPQDYRVYLLHADDVYAVRSFRPGTSLRDAGLASYITQDTPGNNNPTYLTSRPTSFVGRGGSFTLSGPIRLQNLGTQNIVNPTIEVYLTPLRLSWTGAIHLRNLQYRLTARPLDTYHLSMGSIRIPQSVRPGTYYVGFFIRDGGDGYQGNNSAWTLHGATITVTGGR